MKNILPLTLILIICSLKNNAQMSSPMRIRAGEDLYQKLAKEIYLYPSFTQGTITFRDGRANQSNFNYNFLNGELQFITTTGDTLSVDNEPTIKHIAIAKDSFFYSDGYLQLVEGNETVKIVKKQRIKIIDQQKIGAYDQPNAAGAITSYSSLTNTLKDFKLDVRQDVIMAKVTTFYFSDKFNNFQRLNKRNIIKTFHKNEAALNDYFKNNNVDFNKEEDLIKLLAVLKN